MKASPLHMTIHDVPSFTVKQVTALTGVTQRKYSYLQLHGYLTPRDGSESAEGINYPMLCLLARIAEAEEDGLTIQDAASYAHALAIEDSKPPALFTPVAAQTTNRAALLKAAASVRKIQATLGTVLSDLHHTLSADNSGLDAE